MEDLGTVATDTLWYAEKKCTSTRTKDRKDFGPMNRSED